MPKATAHGESPITHTELQTLYSESYIFCVFATFVFYLYRNKLYKRIDSEAPLNILLVELNRLA